VAWAALGSAALAKEHPPLPADAIEWRRPLAGAVLIGGGSARLEWQPASRFGELIEVEEWELFLSADGGRTWPIRLTQHLSSDRRSVLIEVPNLSVLDGRLMLRMGNEELEYEAVLPGHVEIRAADGRPEILPPTAVTTSPDAPAANEAEVMLWAAGDRNGEGTRWVVRAAARDAKLEGEPASIRARRSGFPFLPKPRPQLVRHQGAGSPARALGSSHLAQSCQAPLDFASSPRLATCRSNR
jgi:hypothetical protein